MPLIETHAHLDDPRFAEDQGAVIARAHDAGVTRIITIGTGLESNKAALALADRYGSVYAAVGIHPANVLEEGLDFLEELRLLAAHPKVVALGEIGIDYFHVPSNSTEVAENAWRENQQEAFRMQLELALELGLNVIIHQRDLPDSTAAWEDTLKILKPYTGKVRGVFHCFGGTPEQASELATLGHLVSFTGIITFKNAPIVRETAAAVAADGYMLETDCPYLAPIPHRGTRAEPAYTRLVAEAVAKARGISLEEVAQATTATAEKFFRFS
jgi:TatD DNase family protein